MLPRDCEKVSCVFVVARSYEQNFISKGMLQVHVEQGDGGSSCTANLAKVIAFIQHALFTLQGFDKHHINSSDIVQANVLRFRERNIRIGSLGPQQYPENGMKRKTATTEHCQSNHSSIAAR